MRRVIIPPMLSALITTALSGVDGMVFAKHGPCPHCGGTLTGYDEKRRRFAVLLEGENQREISVRVRRFRCGKCGRISTAQAPFYPDTRYGSAVVDLCVVMSRTFPRSRVATVLRSMGVIVNRGTVRNYAARDFGTIPFTEIFRIPIPMSVIHLSALLSEKEASIAGAVLFSRSSGITADRTAEHRSPS
ncbi:MAG: DUF6431 domain-containing protein [Methanomicrobiales archaeon]|nr:DUF6431 domain-containing protein [Methanomicrobiales archaeon]